VVEALLAVGADPGAAAAHSQVTPLIRAAEGGHREVASLLLARGADPNAVDAEGGSPLAAAAEYGDPELVQLLLKAGADPKRRGTDGRAPADRARGPFTREIHALVPREEGPSANRKKAARRKGPESPEGRP
jgi:ankyrin repeat protein